MINVDKHIQALDVVREMIFVKIDRAVYEHTVLADIVAKKDLVIKRIAAIIAQIESELPEIASGSEFRKAYFNEEKDPKTNEPYGYRVKTGDGSVFGSEVNKERVRNGFNPI